MDAIPPRRLVETVLEADSVSVVVHRQADLDAIGSALGLAAAMPATTRIVAPDGIESRARPLVSQHPQGDVLTEDPVLLSDSPVIVVDAPNYERIAPAEPDPSEQEVFVIDHHQPGDLVAAATASFIATDAAATAALVAKVVQAAGLDLIPAVAYPLAAGFADDLGSLANANASQFAELAELLSNLEQYGSDLGPLLQRDRSFDERKAVATAMARASVYGAGETLLAVTHVGAHETAAAHGLRGCGVDLVFVLSSQGSRLRIVGRASGRVTDTVPLPTVFDGLTATFGGDGGGHDGAGVAHVETTDRSAVHNRLVEIVETQAGVTFGRLHE